MIPCILLRAGVNKKTSGCLGSQRLGLYLGRQTHNKERHHMYLLDVHLEDTYAGPAYNREAMARGEVQMQMPGQVVFG